MYVDVHTHLFSPMWRLNLKAYFLTKGYNSYLASVSNLKSHTKDFEKCFTLSMTVPVAGEYEVDFDDFIYEASKKEDKFLGFVSPRHLEYLKYKNIYGVKFHRYVQNIDRPVLKRAFNLMEKRNQIMNIHISEDLIHFDKITNEYIKMFRELLQSYPNVRVIIPHFTALDKFIDLKQVYFDTALIPRTGIQDFIDECGVNKLLYASDFPFTNPDKDYKKKIIPLDTSRKNKMKILRNNAMHLINRVKK
ncbi:MAG: amidohydrolase family protein [Candidatus Nanoarchaeia archaeon]|nr:amidohydrolase family protein [Candidatus Nanoarchaeia archaeon]